MNKILAILLVFSITMAAAAMRGQDTLSSASNVAPQSGQGSSDQGSSDHDISSNQGSSSKQGQSSNQGSSSGTTSSKSSNTDDFSAIISQLLLASTAVDRINILKDDSNFTFSFLNPPPITAISFGEGGHNVLANRKNFPGLIGSGMAMSIGFLGPCGLNTPHIHPRATELNFAVNGSLAVGFIAENGARQVLNKVSPGTVTVLPKGSIHWEANLDCDPVIFVAAFNDEDPGTSQVAQNFYAIDESILSAALGGADADTIKKTSSIIPKNIAMGIQECLQRCGISNGGSGSGNYDPSNSVY